MGISVDQVTCIDILNDIPHYIKTTKKMTVTSVNPQIIVEGQKYPEIIKFIEESTYRIPDGIGIVMVSKMTGGEIFRICQSTPTPCLFLWSQTRCFARCNEKYPNKIS
jgi:UDP-N-acetyl-D-mannosaminuronic acid transferase (WecB/TagA/CpsF family)